MRVVDLNASIGRTPHGGRVQPLDALVRLAARHGVALVGACSLRGVFYDHRVGNDETVRIAQEHPGVLPVGTINPKQVDGDDEADRCIAAGLRLFRFYPEQQGWQVDSPVFRRIARRLGEGGAAISVVLGGWGTVGTLAAATADLGVTVIALGVHYFQLGDAVEALRQFPHLYAETSRLGTHGALKHLVERVGAERVVFGSGMPEKPLTSALNAVWLADLTDDERARILSENALRLLSQVSDAPTASAGGSATALNPPASLPLLTARHAQPPALPERIFDVHGHLGRFQVAVPELTPAETVQRLARYHVQRIVVSSTLALSYDVRAGNEQVAAAVAAQPELLGYAVLDPHDVAGAADELHRCFRQDGFVGVKLHARLSGKPTSSEQFAALFELIAPYRCPVLIHNDGPDYAEAILRLARAHPQLPIIIAHAGPSRPDEAAFRAAARVEHLYLEFATTFPWRGAVRRAIEVAGVERVLFGSDFPLIDPGYVLGHYQEADLSADEQQAIMWDNAARLFSLA
jgi:uncharacterized protein